MPSLKSGSDKSGSDEIGLTLNGVRHWVRVVPDARTSIAPLVVIHGGPGGNNYVFERTIGPLLEIFSTIVYYEQRGCGRSARPEDSAAYSVPILVSDLEELRRALAIERLVPLGYSFGAELAVEYAIAHPDRVSRLILQSFGVSVPADAARVQLAGFASVASGPMRDQVEAIIDGAGTEEERLDRVWSVVDNATVDRFLFHSAQPAALNRELWRASGLPNTGDMARALRAHVHERIPLARRLHAIACPTLLLIGRHDRNVGLDAARRTATLIPGGTIKVFDDSAHFPDIEQPVEYAEAVRSFLSW